MSLHENRLAVGSPMSADPGVLEVQSLTCQADGGYFTVTFDTHTSTKVQWDATADEFRVTCLKFCMLELPNVTGEGTTEHIGIDSRSIHRHCNTDEYIRLRVQRRKSCCYQDYVCVPSGVCDP